MNLGREILDTLTWYFMAPSELWQYTFSKKFKQEPHEVQQKMLTYLESMEKMRPEDINMKVRFE